MTIAIAVSDLALRFSEALAQFSEDLRDSSLPEEQQLSAGSTGGESNPLDSVLDKLGSRQREIIERASDLDTESGMRTSEVNAAIERQDLPNTTTALNALRNRGIVEHVPGATPIRWRFVPRYRSSSSDPYVKIATLVRPGEWTTYGDVSIAVRGDTLAARAVGRAAAKLPDFPAPHRVLYAGGVIPPGWKSASGQGVEECRRRLEAEGIAVDEANRADPRKRVTWDVLVERSEAAA